MKNIKKSLRSVFCALLAAAALAASLPAYAVSQAEIDDLQKKLDALEQQAQEQQDVINDLTSQKARFITRKLALDNKIEINRQMIELIGEQIEIYDEIITEKQAELDKALEKETTQTELLRSRIRAMEENSTYSYASFIFDSSSVTELLSRIGDVNDIMHYDKTLEEEYMAAREDVESIKKSYEEARHEQELLQKELDTKQAELDAQVEAAYTMIADIETLSDDAQAEYDAIALAEDEAMQELLKAMQEYAAQQAAQRTSYSGSTGGGSTSSGTASSGAGTSGTGGAYGNTSNASGAYNGTFIWPVDSTYITSRYGERSAPTAGASTNHKAIDIGAKSGDPIYAAADGQVASATYNNGLGYYVSIEHDGETATRYSHMTNFIVQPGEHVKQGQIIGYVGESGIATGSHLDYAVIKNGQQVDPMQYYDESTVTYDPTA